MSRLFIIAGEASGDGHGGKLAEALLARDSTLVLEGIGGAAMEKAGVRLSHDIRHLGVVGVIEVLSQWRAIWRAYDGVRRRLRESPPAAIVLIDYPDFNLRVAREAARLGIPVVYYVSPQIWAWRPGRIAHIKACVDLMLVLFRFEEELYRRAGVPCRWVGHPLLDDPSPEADHAAFARRHRIADGRRVLAVLPGSRKQEVAMLLPVMLDAARRVCASGAADRVLIAAAPSVDARAIDDAVSRMGDAASAVTVVRGEAASVLRASRAALVASGTATLQAAVVGTPLVMAYRVSPLTAWIGRRLISTPHLALVNVVAGRRVVTELVQEQATAEVLAAAIAPLLADDRANEAMRRELAAVRAALGEPGASGRAADAVLALLAGRRAV
ncbi:MAG: lipid-A-disaccharide synthase [Nitrospirota bacterium]